MHRNLIILAVDDDMEDLELIEDSILHSEPGAQLKKLTDGSVVLPYLEELSNHELPHLIILDYNMPEMNGAEVISQLCKLPRYAKIPKVVLSTSNSPAHLHECMSKGATRYFEKPNNMPDLRKLAKELLSYCAGKDYKETGK